jgi:hypothetical protein
MGKKINWNKFLFRSSGMANIMSGTVGLTKAQRLTLEDLKAKSVAVTGLTDKQQELLDSLNDKESLTDKQRSTMDELIKKKTEVKGLTPRQKETMDELSALEFDDTLPVGVQNYLKKLYRENKYNRRKRLESKYILKGNMQEEEAITMYSMYTGEVFFNNKERVNNKWITGEYDMYSGDDINSITEGYDTKCSFDLSTFPFGDEPLDLNYYYQNMSYMWLSGSEKWTTVYCLTNTPMKMIKDMIYREDFRWDTDDAPKSAKLNILNNNIYDDATFADAMMIFDCLPDVEDDSEDNLMCADIVNNFVPMELDERIIEKVVYRDESVIDEMKKRIHLCRRFLTNLEKTKK